MAAGRKTGGRQKGTPNKTTAAIKEMVVEALNNKGGVEYLELQAENNPTAFMTLVGKVLPLQLTGANDGPLEIVTRVEIVAPGNDDSED